jgi:hypothetical protein
MQSTGTTLRPIRSATRPYGSASTIPATWSNVSFQPLRGAGSPWTSGDLHGEAVLPLLGLPRKGARVDACGDLPADNGLEYLELGSVGQDVAKVDCHDGDADEYHDNTL